MSLGLSWIFSWSQVYMSYFLGRVHRNFVDFSRPIYPMDWLPEKMTSDCRLYLVGGLEQWNFMTFHIGNVIIPTDELILFRGVSSIHQPAIDSIDYALNAFWDYAMILSEVRFVNAGPKSSNIHVCFRSEIAPKCEFVGHLRRHRRGGLPLPRRSWIASSNTWGECQIECQCLCHKISNNMSEYVCIIMYIIYIIYIIYIYIYI